MIPGPDQIIACPKCKGLGRYMTLVSGNTIGERVWSDGRQIYPMLPRPPAVVKCRHCAGCYWLSDAEEVGTDYGVEGEGEDDNPDWADAGNIEEPTEEEYYDALDKGLARDALQERSLRILAWWRRNDAFRDAAQELPQGDSTVQGACRENLVALVKLLGTDDDVDCLMKVEVLRELGRFESAKEVLSGVDSSNVAAVARQFRVFCDNQDTCVRELHFDH